MNLFAAGWGEFPRTVCPDMTVIKRISEKFGRRSAGPLPRNPFSCGGKIKNEILIFICKPSHEYRINELSCHSLPTKLITFFVKDQIFSPNYAKIYLVLCQSHFFHFTAYYPSKPNQKYSLQTILFHNKNMNFNFWQSSFFGHF